MPVLDRMHAIENLRGQMPDGANTTDRLRHDIDSVRSRDVVNLMGPASAPLGTDDEPAGTPPPPEQIQTASEYRVLNRSNGPPSRKLKDWDYASRNYQSGTSFYVVAMACGAVGFSAVLLIWLLLG